MKFTINWLEYINPEHTCKELGINSFEIDEVENPDNYKKILKEILAGLPSNSKHTGELMGNWEFECNDIFEANSIEEAKEETKKYECGDNHIFVVLDNNNKRIFDEQDIIN